MGISFYPKTPLTSPFHFWILQIFVTGVTRFFYIKLKYPGIYRVFWINIKICIFCSYRRVFWSINPHIYPYSRTPLKCILRYRFYDSWTGVGGQKVKTSPALSLSKYIMTKVPPTRQKSKIINFGRLNPS